MKNRIRKLSRKEILFEVITWGAIVFATLFVAFYFPAIQAFSALLYVLVGATLTSTFWYLRSRRLYILALEGADEIQEKNRELLKQRSTAELIFEHASDGILIIDDALKIVGYSKGLEKMTGYKKTEVLGKKANQLFKFFGHNGLPPIFDIILLPKDTTRKKYRIGCYLDNGLVKKNGQTIQVEIAYDSLKDPVSGHIFALAVLRDITYEQEVRRRDREFVSMASHQIYTPLSMIRGFLSLLLEKKSALNINQIDYLDKAYQATRRLGTLVATLLSTSKIDAGKMGLEVVKFDLIKLLTEVIDELNSASTDVRSTVTLQTDLQKLEINADKEKIRQIVNIVIDNAVKYGRNQKVIVSISKNDTIASVGVLDNGIGIPQSEIDRIGGKFYRAKNAISHDTKGSGLGLFIASYILEQHHGELKIESKENLWTRVTISLPLN